MIHTDIKIAKNQIASVMDRLNHELGGDDEQLVIDCLEGETPLFDIARQLLDANADDEGLIASIDQRIADINIRKDRAKLRIERRKSALISLMDIAAIKKLPLPEATVSLRTLLGRAKVIDPDLLPDAFVKVSEVRKPDMDAINTAVENGAQIPGVIKTNGSASLSVRRK
jgi:hypothetical protein